MVQPALLAGTELRKKKKFVSCFAGREKEGEREREREGGQRLSPTVRDGCSTFYPNFPTLNTWTIKGHAEL